MQIRVGDICKFDDFEPIECRRPCFKIGQVTEIKGDIVFYIILLDIWQGEKYDSDLVGEIANCPLPGMLYYDWPSRIQVLG